MIRSNAKYQGSQPESMLESKQTDVRMLSAMTLHQAGHFVRANAIYREILYDNPYDDSALHMLGVLLRSQGDVDGAIDMISKSIAITPDNAVAHYNLGNAMRQRKRLTQAFFCYDNALRLQPNFVAAHSNRADILLESGQTELALASYQIALQFEPNLVEALDQMGGLLKKKGQLQEALKCYDKALRARPNYAPVLNNRAALLSLLHRDFEALQDARQAVHAAPTFVDALTNCGNLLLKLERAEEALQYYERAILLDSECAALYQMRGRIMQKLRRWDDALRDHTLASGLDPRLASAKNSIGHVLSILGQHAEALQFFKHALEIEPGHCAAWNNYGVALRELGRIEEALECFLLVQSFDASLPEGHIGEFYCRHLLGQPLQAWPKYEWRKISPRVHALREPLWLGVEPLQGKTILLHAEQGLGDVIHFSRYAPLVAALGAKVLLEVPPALARALDKLSGVSQLLVQGQPLPAFDYQCPLMSLPLAFKTGLDNIPADIPYLYAEPAGKRRWAKQLSGIDKRLPGLPRIGLAWSGNPLHHNDINRSIPLAQFARITSYSKAEFVCLQKDVREADATVLADLPQISVFSELLVDMQDTIDLIANMDLVITVDTSVAHLAAAMGKPTWTLLSFNVEWRWMLERSDTPWYPTMRLFRQRTPGDWSQVFDDILTELASA